MSEFSQEILSIAHAFSDAERKQRVRLLANRAKSLEVFVRECRDNFDCDSDAHKYGTLCRACAAEKLIPKA